MYSLFELIYIILDLLKYMLIIVAIMSWLINFSVINIHNSVIRAIWDTLNAITEPLLRPIRRRLPNFNGVDLSPMVLILLILFLQLLITEYVFQPKVFG